ncbi:MAG: DsbA family protein [Fibrobacterota bacterium]
MKYLNLLFVFLLLFSTFLFAEDVCPEKLEDDSKKEMAEKAMKNFYLYDCTEATIYDAVKEDSVCALAKRLYDYTCELAANLKSYEKVLEGLEKRRLSMMPPEEKAEIVLDSAFLIGVPASPVTFVTYICSRCPYCKQFTLKLIDRIEKGDMKGKVRMFVRPWPLKNHEGSKVGAAAMVAAAEMGKFRDFLKIMYNDYENYSVENLPVYAEKAGLSSNKFKKLMEADSIVERVVRIKKEGYRNGLDQTPTFFINGRFYKGFLNYPSVTDALLEEYDYLTGNKYITD